MQGHPSWEFYLIVGVFFALFSLAIVTLFILPMLLFRSKRVAPKRNIMALLAGTNGLLGVIMLIVVLSNMGRHTAFRSGPGDTIMLAALAVDIVTLAVISFV